MSVEIHDSAGIVNEVKILAISDDAKKQLSVDLLVPLIRVHRSPSPKTMRINYNMVQIAPGVSIVLGGAGDRPPQKQSEKVICIDKG